MTRWIRWPAGTHNHTPLAGPNGPIAFGGDYNPEQWPEEVWHEDVRLMREAGVNLVSLGIFSWALLEPREGTYDFGWLDRVMDLLHEHGIAVDLATATASPPPWLSRAHPEMLPEQVDGTKLWWGSRQAYCPSSTAYRAAAVRLCTAVAERYRDHPVEPAEVVRPLARLEQRPAEDGQADDVDAGLLHQPRVLRPDLLRPLLRVESAPYSRPGTAGHASVVIRSSRRAGPPEEPGGGSAERRAAVRTSQHFRTSRRSSGRRRTLREPPRLVAVTLQPC